MEKKLIYLLSVIILMFIALEATKIFKAPKSQISQEVIQATPVPEIMPTEKNIIVTSPTLNQQVSSPLIVSGQARVLENSLNYRLKDSTGKILITGKGTVLGSEVGEFGQFELTITYPKPLTKYGVLEVYSLSAKDGTELETNKSITIVKFP